MTKILRLGQSREICIFQTCVKKKVNNKLTNLISRSGINGEKLPVKIIYVHRGKSEGKNFTGLEVLVDLCELAMLQDALSQSLEGLV